LGDSSIATASTTLASLGAQPITQPVPDLGDRTVNSAVDVEPDGSPQLVGSRCGSCGALMVPETFVCSSCASRQLQRALAGSSGTLYSYSTVHVSSSRPTPYTLGYVDLDSGSRVLATITGDTDLLRPDVRVRLSVGSDHSWSFIAVQEEESS